MDALVKLDETYLVAFGGVCVLQQLYQHRIDEFLPFFYYASLVDVALSKCFQK